MNRARDEMIGLEVMRQDEGFEDARGDMRIDLSRMRPEDAELILALLSDERSADKPKVQELLQRLTMSTPTSTQRDTRGGPNMMTPTGHVTPTDAYFNDIQRLAKDPSFMKYMKETGSVR